MMNFVVDIINKQRLIRKLDNIGKIKDRREVVRKAARESARPLYQATKKTTGFKNHSGLLRAAIKLRASKKSRIRVGVNVIIRKLDWKVAEAKGLVRGSKKRRPAKQWAVFYGSFVELGTKYLTARHFMRNEARKHKRAVMDDFMRRIFSLIKDLAK